MESSSKSSSSLGQSVRAGSASTSSGSQPLDKQRKSSVGKIMDKAKSKINGRERLSDDADDFEKSKAKEVEKQKKKEEYERLGLGDKTKFGRSLDVDQ